MKKLTLKQAREDIAACRKACENSKEALQRAIYLAIASMRVQSKIFWPNLPQAYAVFEQHGPIMKSGTINQFHFGHKTKSLNWMRENIDLIYENVMTGSADDGHEWLVKNHPGLKPVKAGFIIQLSHGKLGCIDTVNQKRLNIDPVEFYKILNRKDGASYYRQMLKGNLDLSCVKLWRDWCNTVAEVQGFNPVQLSKMHVDHITASTRKYVLN